MTETKQKYKYIITQNIIHISGMDTRILYVMLPQTVGRRDKPEINYWFDHDCRLVSEKKNIAYKKMIQGRFTRTAEQEYKETRKEGKKYIEKKENIIIIT